MVRLERCQDRVVKSSKDDFSRAFCATVLLESSIKVEEDIGRAMKTLGSMTADSRGVVTGGSANPKS